MRMYLSSFRPGNKPQALLELVGTDRRVAIVMNALNNFPDERAQWLNGQSTALAQLGFSILEFDPRTYFGRENDFREFAGNVNTFWINGGNAFIARRAMKQAVSIASFKKRSRATPTSMRASASHL